MNRNAFVSAHRAALSRIGTFLALMALMLPLAARSQDVVINEIMASNASIAPLTNNPTYFPDFVELYNRTASPIDLNAGGWVISDKREPKVNDFKDFYLFPAGTIIPANGYLLVFFDDKTNNAGIHTTYTVNGTNVTFTLRAGGDWVHLFKGFGTLSFASVSSNGFGPQITDRSIGRVPDGDPSELAWTLTLPSPNGGSLPAGPNVAAPFQPVPTASTDLTLKINEWLAFNLTGSGKTNDDWFEIYNPDPNNIVSMGGMAFVDRGSVNDPDDLWKPENQLPKMSFIAPLGFVTIIADDDENNEDNNSKDPDVVDFSLSSTGANGDFISMHASTNQGAALIDQVIWTAPLQSPTLSRGRVPDGSTNIVVLPNTTRGEKNFGAIPEIVISEVLPHTDPPFEDAIELQNVTSTNVNIGDWWLTNDPEVPRKFRIPAGTIVPPGGFVVFYEGRGLPASGVGFNKKGTGNTPEFTLNSARGDEVYLFRGRPDGSVTGDRRGIDFGPSENGVSFGRYVTSAFNGSDVDYVAMSARTLGQDNPTTVAQFRLGTGKTNAAPKVGPVIITEIFYHPHLGAPNDELYEFIEIRNISDNVVPLYDPAFPTNQWRIKDAVGLTFPPNQSLMPDEYALIVNFNPVTNLVQLAAFTAAFPNIPAGTKIYGPYDGELNDSDARVELAWPDHPQAAGRVDAGLVPYIVMDRVNYEDKAPWPVNSDGSGGSLQRRVESDYGNDAINWMGRIPTPGRFNGDSIEPPRITGQPESKTVKELFNTELSVRIRGGERTIQWYFNGQVLPDATDATLSFIGVSLDDAGDYHAIASNTSGSVTSLVATLTVTPSPADLTRPTVKITSPAANSRLTTSSVTLQGLATDNTALARVEYRIGANNYVTATGLSPWSAEIVLEPGTNLITARAVDTSGNSFESPIHKLIYVVTSPLDLSVNGNGTVSGATDGQALEVGRNYTLTATPAAGSVFSNWTGDVSGVSPKLSFTMQADLEVVANFVPNPFAPVDGKYNGLFYESAGVEHASSGFFNLTVTERGTYTAAITAAGKKLRATGTFDLEGRATNVITRVGANSLTITWALHLDGSDKVSGTVTDGAWTAELAGDRAVFGPTNPYSEGGKFTFVIPGTPADTTAPEGDSYGTVSIDPKGVIAFKGFLADKTPAVQKVPVSKNGEWPLFVSLYKGQGSILGWITNVPDGDFEGTVNWSKPALATSKYYAAGFDNAYTMIGSRYTAPVGTNRVLDVTDALVSFAGGNLAQAFTNEVTLGLSSKVMNNTPANRLVFTFTLPTGLFKGTVTPAGATKAIPFAGAVLQRGANASGYFLGTNQSGRVLFEAAPLP